MWQSLLLLLPLIDFSQASPVAPAPPQKVSARAIEPLTWDPPSELVTPLEEVWQHELSTYGDALGFMNYGFDQLFANNGSVNYCVQWQSTAELDENLRAGITATLERSFAKWMEWLYEFESFPYTDIPLTVVGWAVADTSLLTGDTSGLNIYTDLDASGIAQCPEACGRLFHLDNDYSGCAAGVENHYDVSLLLTEGLTGGFGGDFGQNVGSEYIVETLDTDSVHILLHEMGHTFGLDDFYDWTPTGVSEFIMLSGSSLVITDFDGWMLRDWWVNLKDRYGL